MRHHVLLTALLLLCSLTSQAQNKFPNNKAEVLKILNETLYSPDYKYMFIDIDNDGCSELFAQDSDGFQCVIAWNGKRFTVAELGDSRYYITYNNGVIYVLGSGGTGMSVETVVTIENSTIATNITQTKLYDMEGVLREHNISGGTEKQLEKALQQYGTNKAQRIDYDSDDTLPFNNFCGESSNQ